MKLSAIGSIIRVDTHYIIGSVVGPHPYPDMVARFQSVISEEMRWQLKEKTGNELPMYVMACVGGGSNAAGAFYHFLDEPSVKLVAVEAAGHGIDSGMSAATTQLGRDWYFAWQQKLGDANRRWTGNGAAQHFSRVGLSRYWPMHAHFLESGRGKFLSATDDEALQAAFELAKLEGIIPALESAHALSALNK